MLPCIRAGLILDISKIVDRTDTSGVKTVHPITTNNAMINLAGLILAALALSPMIGAVTVPDTNTGLTSEAEVERFSFAKWVDDIIANRNGTLSPEQAYEQWQTTVANAVEPCKHATAF